MKVARGLYVWLVLAACAVLVVGAMAWLTHNVLESKREQARSEVRAVLEEQTRLALWRMDTAGAAILLRENQRPPGDEEAGLATDAPEVKARFTLMEGEERIKVARGSAVNEIPGLTPELCGAALGKGNSPGRRYRGTTGSSSSRSRS